MESRNTKCTDGWVTFNFASYHGFSHPLLAHPSGPSHFGGVHGSPDPTRWQAVAIRW